MSNKTKAVPDGYAGAIPYLCCRDAARAIDFYKQAFGASERLRMADPAGKIGHAEISIGEALIMLSDEFPDHGALSPQTVGGSPVGIHIYVDNVDQLAERAVAAGASMPRPPADQFYGDRSATLVDPFGHRWFFATHVEDVSHEELRRRHDAMLKG